MNELPIDARFRDSDTGELIANCLVCNKELVKSQSEYFVERIFRRLPKLGIVEPIFEYAMCSSCGNNYRKIL